MLPQFMISGKHDFYADFPITFRLQLSGRGFPSPRGMCGLCCIVSFVRVSPVFLRSNAFKRVPTGLVRWFASSNSSALRLGFRTFRWRFHWTNLVKWMVENQMKNKLKSDFNAQPRHVTFSNLKTRFGIDFWWSIFQLQTVDVEGIAISNSDVM